MTPIYRDFYFPLNVFMHILTHEEGRVPYLHYGLFRAGVTSIVEAQERSTELLLDRLPAQPAKLLDVGCGLGTTLARLADRGYEVLGITPDEKQIAAIRERFGDSVKIRCTRLEDIDSEAFDAIYFQESSQYIDSEALFAKAETLTRHVIVLDEFATRPLDHEGALHTLDRFLDAASRHGFRLLENVDLTREAAPSIDYFLPRLPRYRDALKSDLGLTDEQVDHLISSGERYKLLYSVGTYEYHLLQLRGPA